MSSLQGNILCWPANIFNKKLKIYDEAQQVVAKTENEEIMLTEIEEAEYFREEKQSIFFSSN